MRIKFAIFIYILTFIILLQSIQAVEVDFWWKDSAKVDDTTFSYRIINKEDAIVEVAVEFLIYEEYDHPYFEISYYPWEQLHNLPAEFMNITLCKGRPSVRSFGPFGFNFKCNKIDYNLSSSEKGKVGTIIDGKYYPEFISKQYRLKFIPEDEDFYILYVKYKIPNFIFKQGDYYVAWINFHNMRDFPITTYLTLPGKNAIPYRFPEDAVLDRYAYKDGNKYEYQWVFTFEGDKDHIVWYTDYVEKEWIKPLKLILIGFLAGLFVTIVSIVYNHYKNKKNYKKIEEIKENISENKNILTEIKNSFKKKRKKKNG